MGSWHTFDNYGYILESVPNNIMDIFKAEREKYRNGDPISRHMNGSLIGQINKEHDISYLKDSVEVMDFLNTVASDYIKMFNVPLRPTEVKTTGTNQWDIELYSLWMNIQERGEYNPVHAHGGIVSFVIWLEIPYDINAERALDNSRYSNNPANADFFFHPVDVIGNPQYVPMNVGKDKEGTICVFHAQMLHSVNPFFTTDKQRVSIAGNFAYKERRDV